MGDVRDTDERLRRHLNGRQPDRELMCSAILQIEPGYTAIEPRRPEGGPDSGRDIQCLREGRRCFGAVGFKNSVNDSTQQIREIRDKFRSDAKSAKSADPEVTDFVFFTNVDLTPGEQDDLKSFAYSNGFTEVEIYWRERIRLILDSPEGYAIRLSFLDIPLTDAEQKVFFTRFGKELQNLISGQLKSVEERIEEIQFVNWKRGKLREITYNVKLRKLYRVEGTEHRPFRFALRLSRVRMYGEGEMLLGCYSVIHQDEERADFEVRRFIYSDTDLLPNDRGKHTMFPQSTRVIGQPFDSIRFGCSFGSSHTGLGDPGIEVGKLGQYAIDFYCDAGWADRVERVEVWYDDYLVHEFVNDGKRVRIKDVNQVPHWPSSASEVSDLPVQFWHGWCHGFDRICRRKRIGER